MSSDLEAETGDICCACCGIAEDDDIKLKECNDCDLVRYCSDECQAKHRPHHESKCERLNSVTRFYLGSMKVATMVTAPSAFCRFQWTQINHH